MTHCKKKKHYHKDNRLSDCNDIENKKSIPNEISDKCKEDSSIVDGKDDRLGNHSNTVRNYLMSNAFLDEEKADSSVVDAPRTFVTPPTNRPLK